MLFARLGPCLRSVREAALGPALIILDRFLEMPEFAKSLAKPKRFTRRRGPFSLRATLAMFLAQCLSTDHSCRTAVAHAKDRGLLPEDVAPNSGGYCRARDGLAAEGLQGASTQIGEALESRCTEDDLWLGRRVRAVDGTSVTLPDTEENQATYPQPSSQKPGCGFPVAYMLALFSLMTGALLKYVLYSKGGNELTPFSHLLSFFRRGDIALGDRAYGAFGTIAVLLAAGVDSVFRPYGARKNDHRTVRRLGRGDRLVRWQRSSWPRWWPKMAPLVESLELREIRFRVPRLGFRTKEIVLVTTLLDPFDYPAEAVQGLYLRRWSLELWLRHMKTTLGMDTLRTKTPDRVHAEIAMFAIGYNLTRTVMWDASKEHAVPLDRLSFKSAVVRVQIWITRHGTGAAREQIEVSYKRLLLDLARDRNPFRPGRVEPRAIKRRRKEYDLLNRSRAELRAELLASC